MPTQRFSGIRRSRKRRSSQIRTVTSKQGPNTTIIASSTSSELSRSPSPNIVSRNRKRPLTLRKTKSAHRNKKTVALERGTDPTGPNGIQGFATTENSNKETEQEIAGKGGQLRIPLTSIQARPEVRVVISTTQADPHVSKQRSVVPYSGQVVGLEPSNRSETEEDLPSQPHITLRCPVEINNLAKRYQNLPRSEQRKYLKTEELRRAIWPKENRPPDLLLQLALFSMRRQERHCKFPFAFDSQGCPYAEYDHLRVNEQSSSDNSKVIPSVETRRRDRSRPSSNIKTEQRLPARYSPDLWIQDQASFSQEVTLRAENESFKKENKKLKAEIEQLKENGLIMSEQLKNLQKVPSELSEEPDRRNDRFIPGSGGTFGQGTTVVLRIHNVSSCTVSQPLEPAQA